jgi:hypothetical protein
MQGDIIPIVTGVHNTPVRRENSVRRFRGEYARDEVDDIGISIACWSPSPPRVRRDDAAETSGMGPGPGMPGSRNARYARAPEH